METQETLHECIARLGLTVRADFVPFSKSRNAGDKVRSLNWIVTLVRNGRDILTTDYMAGTGHCPAHSAPVKLAGNPRSLLRAQAIERETETGVATTFAAHGLAMLQRGAPINPDAASVVHCLIMDADVLDYRNFEEWAGEVGFDPDSRKAEATYKACMEIALSLRNGLGDADYSALRAASAEF